MENVKVNSVDGVVYTIKNVYYTQDMGQYIHYWVMNTDQGLNTLHIIDKEDNVCIQNDYTTQKMPQEFYQDLIVFNE